ncbi:hypothetical protein PROFUN_12201 [Planoprotostelium fungivorum]|uniref:Uncharacterized protein n=1 Tax=Planoprotostelium fungivorum TaxID=1890364 RepID=A0A2P6N830_9EUKA|nr:hypothetical protein PROFUN_12201 [Planoprotostelium fungivorum]
MTVTVAKHSLHPSSVSLSYIHTSLKGHPKTLQRRGSLNVKNRRQLTMEGIFHIGPDGTATNMMEPIENLDLDSWSLDELLRPLSEWKPEKDRMFETFLVAGLSGDRKPKANTTPSLPSEIIYSHPAKHDLTTSTLMAYLFPDSKVPIDSVDKTQSMTDINTVLFWQTSALVGVEHSFVLQLGK